jgi:translation initiation factor 2 subunit 1
LSEAEQRFLKPRKPLPDVGELVVGTVVEVHDYGAYLLLDEYGGVRAFLPWSEVASRAVRSIHQVLRPRQKVVVKVIRVYKKRGEVDVSLKRVMDSERKRKIMYFKRYLKAASIIEYVAKELGKSVDDAYREVIWKLEDAYGDPMRGLEEAVIRGREAFEKAGIPEEWIEPLLQAAKVHVKVKTVKISGVFTLQSKAPDGVERIRSVLEAARKALEGAGLNVKGRIYTIGSPRYRIDVQGYDYKELEKALQAAVKAAEEAADEMKVDFSFERLEE